MAKLVKAQNHTNSCGATCLLVASLELGITHTPNDFSHLWFGKELKLDMTCETEIYQHTTNGQNTGYSMPSSLATAAQDLGFNVKLYLNGTILPRILTWFYPNEEAICRQNNIEIIYSAPENLDEYSRLICVVAVGGLGLHYLLYRGDGSYMDPAYGINYTGSMWGLGQLRVLRYIDMGIYVYISTAHVI